MALPFLGTPDSFDIAKQEQSRQRSIEKTTTIESIQNAIGASVPALSGVVAGVFASSPLIGLGTSYVTDQLRQASRDRSQRRQARRLENRQRKAAADLLVESGQFQNRRDALAAIEELRTKQARKQKRRLKYIANIYVVKDPANPQNEGKVFLYQFGKKIFDKINDLMNPQFEDEDPINPFDFWEGANFKLKIRNVEGYRNYDKSEFETSSTLGEFEDEELETVWKQQHSLAEFTAPENFKSYEELEAKLNKVLGLDGAKPVPKGRAADEEELDEVQNFRPSASASVGKTASVPKADEIPWDTDSEDDSLSFFENLAKED